MKKIFFMSLILILISSYASAFTLYGNICATENCTCNSNGLCNQNFPNGISVLLTPKPNPGKYFVGWVGDTDCIRAEACSVLMNRDKHITALFGDIAMRRLHIHIKGGGNGKIGIVAPEGEKVVDQATPSGTYHDKTTITLIALPDSESVFIKWDMNVGRCSGTENCRVVMTTDKIVVAVFEKRRP